MFTPPVNEPPQIPPIGRREIAMEELHRVQLYTTELRALLSHPRLPAASWPQIATGLVDRVATTVDAARLALQPPSAMLPSVGEGSCTTKDGSDGESSKRSRERSFKISRTNQPYYDGHEWRKYGQKKISGCKFDREYYRCAYKEQGCLAQKQVQQHSDGDSPLYIVKSKFEHTCKSSRDAAAPSGLFPGQGQGIQWFSPSNPASGKPAERPMKCAKLEEGSSPPAVAAGLEGSMEYSSTDGLGSFGHLGFAWDQMLEVAPRSRLSDDEDFFSPELLAELEAIFRDDVGK